jgi:hypothetical protein
VGGVEGVLIMEPVRLIPAGTKIVWSARSVMSNPDIGAVPWINTETFSWLPAIAENVRKLEGHVVDPGLTMQTSPVWGTLTDTVTLWDNDPLIPVTAAE